MEALVDSGTKEALNSSMREPPADTDCTSYGKFSHRQPTQDVRSAVQDDALDTVEHSDLWRNMHDFIDTPAAGLNNTCDCANFQTSYPSFERSQPEHTSPIQFPCEWSYSLSSSSRLLSSIRPPSLMLHFFCKTTRKAQYGHQIPTFPRKQRLVFRNSNTYGCLCP